MNAARALASPKHSLVVAQVPFFHIWASCCENTPISSSSCSHAKAESLSSWRSAAAPGGGVELSARHGLETGLRAHACPLGLIAMSG